MDILRIENGAMTSALARILKMKLRRWRAISLHISARENAETDYGKFGHNSFSGDISGLRVLLLSAGVIQS